MWRDRTNLYISYRQSYAHHPSKPVRFNDTSSNGFADPYAASDERRGLMSAGATDNDGDAIIEMDVLPPRWLDIQDEVTTLLAEISKKMLRLDPMHSKHVLPGFEDEAVKKKEERDIEDLTQEITRNFQNCQRAIKKVEKMVKDSKQQGSMSRGQETMARNLQISLATRVGEVSAGFRKKQANYLKKLRGLSGLGTPMESSAASNQGNPYADPSLMESDADRSFSQSTLQQTAQKRRTNNDSAIAQREREIEDIAQGIIELANIFQDLSSMVIDQGTLLDRIDYNVERTTEHVKAAEKELTVATGYQKRTTKRKIILLLILLVIGMIILVTLKPKRGRSSARPSPVQEPPKPIDAVPP
ncbi:MAG: hypothetical protein M1828_000993 [Chrysothrix sp. TS-e1954]|nr:MAG: hypothetical protein M1828_000993 [Chrysothrix sp. TS-e1954]